MDEFVLGKTTPMFLFASLGYEKIFYFLKQLRGSLRVRLIFLQNIIKEAGRCTVKLS